MTLQQILDHLKIAKETLEEEVDDGHLLEIARKTSNWELYADRLGLSDTDIEGLKRDFNKTELQSRGAFKMWAERKAFMATYLFLVEDVFLKQGNAKMATFVCKLVK